MYTYKHHMAAADQTERWIGALKLDPHRGFIATRCGQVFQPNREWGHIIDREIGPNTCGSCAHSFRAARGLPHPPKSAPPATRPALRLIRGGKYHAA